MIFLNCLTGCETLSYYTQIASGHLGILAKRKPIEDLIKDANTSVKLKTKLQLVMEARAFAEEHLLLATDGHYLHYVDVERPYVVWNVFAAPELSITPKKWCYPIVGCASYRGYYKEELANAYASKLSAEGYDVYIGGVAAYSTLGWFKDPVLSTFVQRSDGQLSSLIFHELAHQKLYVAGDTTFNESFATVIAQEGLRLWVEQKGKPEMYSQFVIQQQRQSDFAQLIIEYRQKLNTIYLAESSTDKNSADLKRREKQEIYDQLRQAYQKLKIEKWQGYNGYDGWFGQDLNNAKLVTVAAYYTYVPTLEKKLVELGNDMAKFYAWCKEIGKLDNEERKKLLAP